MENWISLLLLILVGSASATGPFDVGLDGSIAGAKEVQLGPLSVGGSFAASKDFHVGDGPDSREPSIAPVIISFGTPTPVPSPPTQRAQIAALPAMRNPPPPPPRMRIPPPPPPPTPCNRGRTRSLENATDSGLEMAKNSTNNATLHERNLSMMSPDETAPKDFLPMNATDKEATDNGASHVIQYRSVPNVVNASDSGIAAKNATHNETVYEIKFRAADNITDTAAASNNATNNATSVAKDSTTDVTATHHVKFRSAENATDAASVATEAKNSTSSLNETAAHDLHSSVANATETVLSNNSTQNGNEKDRPVNPKFKGIYDKLRAIFK